MSEREENLIERVTVRDFGGSPYILIPKGVRQRFEADSITGWSMEWHGNPGSDDFTVRMKRPSNNNEKPS